MSRKHIIEVDKHNHHISVFGGKLTDCLNIGKEVLQKYQKLEASQSIQKSSKKYNQKPDSTLSALSQHKLYAKILTDLTKIYAQEKEQLGEEEISEMSRRFVSCYEERSLVIVKELQEKPQKRDVLIPKLCISRAEVEYIAQYEKVITLEDFLRRRTMTALTFSKKELSQMKGMQEVENILFDKQKI